MKKAYALNAYQVIDVTDQDGETDRGTVVDSVRIGGDREIYCVSWDDELADLPSMLLVLNLPELAFTDSDGNPLEVRRVPPEEEDGPANQRF